MGRAGFGMLTGLMVLATAIYTIVDRTEPTPVAETTSTTSATPVVEVVSPEQAVKLPGVADEIVRVLEWSGKAQLADDAAVAELPPAVYRTLIDFGAPLTVETP